MKSKIDKKRFEPFNLTITIESIYDLIGLWSLLNCSGSEFSNKIENFEKYKKFDSDDLNELSVWNINDKSFLWSLIDQKLKEIGIK